MNAVSGCTSWTSILLNPKPVKRLNSRRKTKIFLLRNNHTNLNNNPQRRKRNPPRRARRMRLIILRRKIWGKLKKKPRQLPYRFKSRRLKKLRQFPGTNLKRNLRTNLRRNLSLNLRWKSKWNKSGLTNPSRRMNPNQRPRKGPEELRNDESEPYFIYLSCVSHVLPEVL